MDGMRDPSVKISCLKRRQSFRRRGSSGITLLEVLLTMIILVVGLTMIFQSTRSALQRMTEARELTEAQNASHSVLNELLARTAPIEPEEGRAIGHLPNWRIRVDIYPATQPGLYVLHLSARRYSPEGFFLGVRYQLLRWVPAARVRLPEEVDGFSPFFDSVPFFDTAPSSPFDSLF